MPRPFPNETPAERGEANRWMTGWVLLAIVVVVVLLANAGGL